MVEAAREEAKALIHKDPTLSKYPLLRISAERARESVHPE